MSLEGCMRFLANENFPLDAVEALRTAGFNVSCIRTEAPGSKDPDVLQKASFEAGCCSPLTRISATSPFALDCLRHVESSSFVYRPLLRRRSHCLSSTRCSPEMI